MKTRPELHGESYNAGYTAGFEPGKSMGVSNGRPSSAQRRAARSIEAAESMRVPNEAAESMRVPNGWSNVEAALFIMIGAVLGMIAGWHAGVLVRGWLP